MTRDKKAAAHAPKASASVPYTAARRFTPGPGDNETDYSTPSIEESLKPWLQGACHKLVGESIDSLGDVKVAGPLDVGEPAVHDLQLTTSTIDVQVVEEYESGTKICSVLADATLVVEGLMSRADAAMSAESGLVKIIDLNYHLLYALVAITAAQALQVEFNATVSQNAESVDDVNFVVATPLG